MNRRVQAGSPLALAGLTALTLLLAACGGAAATPGGAANAAGGANAAGSSSTTSITSAPTTAPAAGAASSAAATPAVGSATSTQAAGTAPVKVSANRASRAELQRAFEAAGIPNAARWAVEVEEYRPYPTNDPSWAKLRRELAKYNIAPAVLEQIIITLTLD